VLTIILMLLGAAAELLTIGAVVPFLALLAAPETASINPASAFLVGLLERGPFDNFAVSATLLLVVLALSAAMLRLMLSWGIYKFVFGLAHDIGLAIFQRLLHQPYIFHIRRNSSEVLSAIEKVQSVAFGILLPLLQGATSLVIAFFIIAMLFLVDPVVASIAASSMALVYLLVSLATARVLKLSSTVIATASRERIKVTQEGLGGIREVLIDGSQYVFVETFRSIDREYRNTQSLQAFVGTAPRFVVEAAGIVLIALLALHLSFQPGGVSAVLPVLGALALGAQRLLPLLQLVYQGWSQFRGTRDSLIDVVRLMTAPTGEGGEEALVACDGAPLKFSRVMELTDVSFRYGDGLPAIRNVSLRIHKGTRVGFIGKTGSGKSTLFDLVMGLLTPTSGEIRIDDRPILGRDTRSAWQRQLAHVSQNIYLLDNSIAANIAFGAPGREMDLQRVREVARAAQIGEFIEELPEGYETMIGERGVRLSGGQRQRIGLARALYKKASILVLDEATSALDEETEAAVMDCIGRLHEDLTILMIAHRVSTLSQCNLIVRMEEGRIAGVGSYAEMLGAEATKRSWQ